MKKLLCIGVSHGRDISQTTNQILSDFKPDVLTLETFLSDSLLYDKERLERFQSGKSKFEIRRERGLMIKKEINKNPDGSLFFKDHYYPHLEKIRIYADGINVCSERQIELCPIVSYALDKSLPFYYIDFPFRVTKDIVEFTNSNYRIISLDEEESVKNLSYVEWSDDENLVCNQFWAGAINYLFRQGANRIVHIAGAAHFRGEEEQPMQDFVKADEIIFKDLSVKK